MQSIREFALEARRYVEWANGSDASIQMTPRVALLRLVDLYQSALRLPHPWTDGLNVDGPEEKYTLDDFNQVLTRAEQLPFRAYAEVFNPFADPAEEPILADIGVDIAEIYEDIVRGLRLFESGDFAEARYQWGWGFQYHWGEHATAAIRAIHCYLAQNECDALTDQA